MNEPTVSCRIRHVGRSPAELGRDAIRGAKDAHVDVISLSGAPGHSLPEHVLAEVAAASRTTTHSIHSGGIAELRHAISRKVEAKTGVTVSAETQVIVTNGAMHGLLASAMALADTNDEVLIPSPCYFFRGNFELAGLKPVYAPSRAEDGWALNWPLLEQAIGERTRILCLTTPNNPTGYMLTMEDLDRITSLVRGRNIWVISDESYESVTFDNRKLVGPISHPDLRERTITVKTFSKGYCLRDYRVGYVVAPNAQVGEAIRGGVEWSVLSTSYVGQRAALAALEGPEDWIADMVAQVRANRDKMEARLRPCNRVSWVSPQGGPYLYVDVSQLGGAEAVCDQLLNRYGVATLPASAFKDEGHIRVPFGGPSDRMDEAAERLSRAFSEIS
ncbi:MAG: pyridoxal phosphate-dependent aminotransferase [Variibacter sp.]